MTEFWKPWPKQEFALKQRCFEILYGGARGPGKTDCGIVWMLKGIHQPRYRGLVIRQNSEDLKDWVDRAEHMYRSLGCRVVGKPAEFRFDTGAKIITGHLNDEKALGKYLGHEYQRMLIEELTQIDSELNYLKLLGSCRSTIDGLDARMFATTNPTGPGHTWVKKRFVSPAPAMTKFPDPKTGRSRMFIPGTVDDNPTLIEKDPGYLQWLDGLPDELRKAWRDGSWDVLEGMFFDKFSRDLTVYNPNDVVINKHWKRCISVDWGYGAPMAVYWHAIAPDNHIWTYREWYKTNYLDIDAAREIKEITGDEVIDYSIGDPQSFPVHIAHYKFGKIMSVQRKEIWADEGVPLIMGDSSRVAGWSHMREFLKPIDVLDSKGVVVGRESKWHISNDCVNLIEELSSAVRHKNKPEDISDKVSDHGLESCRLYLMSRKSPHLETKVIYKTDMEAARAQSEREDRAARANTF